MIPHADKLNVMTCHNNEIYPESKLMAGGDILNVWVCPTCHDRHSEKIDEISEDQSFLDE